MKRMLERCRLCFTRSELVRLTGLSYRTLQNLESRGLLKRLPAGVNVALYTAASVEALFVDHRPEGAKGESLNGSIESHSEQKGRANER
jgi:DNA-binding transcriptional MerR regulator